MRSAFARLAPYAPWLGLAAFAALPGDAARSLLAVVAGTLFEASPFVLLRAVVPAPFAGVAALAGCGCGGRRAPPGALAPAAVVLCWLAFGPAIALGRVAAALGIAALARRFGRHGERDGAPAPPDPFGELATIGATAVPAYALATLCPWPAVPAPAALAGGIALGLLAPCATAGVALATALAGHAPAAAVAILATSGVVPGVRIGRGRPPRKRDVRFTSAALAFALAALVASGPAGFVHPRLLPFAAAGSCAALVLAARGNRRGGCGPWPAIPALMLAALALGSPAPRDGATETTLAGGYPGQSAHFFGIARAADARAPTRLVRFAIACCRIDASAVGLTLDRHIVVAPGTWITANGTLEARDGTLVLRVANWHALSPPHDPFVYL